MIAQTIAEYGLLHSIIASMGQAFNRIDSIIGQGNAKYILIGGLVLIILSLATRRRLR